MCEAGWFKCEMPQWFPFTRLTGEQPALALVLMSCHWSGLSAGLRTATHCTHGNLMSLRVWQDAHSATCSYSCIFHDVMLYVCVSIPWLALPDQEDRCCFQPVATIAEHVMSEFVPTWWEFIVVIGKKDKFPTWLKMGCGSGCGLSFR